MLLRAQFTSEGQDSLPPLALNMKPIVTALLALAVVGCGGGGGDSDGDGEARANTTTTKASSQSETAGDFSVRVNEYMQKGQYGLAWQELHPAQRRLIQRSSLASCLSGDLRNYPEATFRVTETYREPWRIWGTKLTRPSTAVTVEFIQEASLENGEPVTSVLDTWTQHAFRVGDNWAWILAPTEIDCATSGEKSASAFQKGYPKKVLRSSLPDYMRSEFDGRYVVAVAPGAWTELAPGTSVLESATNGALSGYCASVNAFEKRTGEDRAGTCW